MLFGTVAGILALAAGILYLIRRRAAIRSRNLTDDMIAQIERSGTVDVDEPLDLGEIAEEEEQFWEEERWDEADEY